MLGHWAAEKMGLPADEVEAYVGAVVKSDFEETGDDDVFRKVKGDLDAKGRSPRRDLRAMMDTLMDKAAREIHDQG